MDFYFDTAKTTFDLATALGKKLFSQKLMPFLASMVNKVEQSHWVSEIALALKTKEEILYQEMAAVKPKMEEEQSGPVPAGVIGEKSLTADLDYQEQVLLSLIIKKPELVQKIGQENEEFLSVQFRDLTKKIKPEENAPVMTQLTSSAESAEGESVPQASTMNLEFAYLKSQELWKDFKDMELEEEFKKTVAQIKRRRITAQLASLEYDIKSAEKEQDTKRLTALIEQFSNISKRLNN